MGHLDQRICAWGGYFCAFAFGLGFFVAGFIPPPSPMMNPVETAAFYREHATGVKAGMVLLLFGLAGMASLCGAITIQMRRMRTGSELPALLQLGSGSIGVLTVMLPAMMLGAAAFRPDRDPNAVQLVHDIAWLIVMPAFPTFIAQFGAIAIGALGDRNETPVYPRWIGYFNIWTAIAFVPGGFAYFFFRGPFAWNGLLTFWVAGTAYFWWLIIMAYQTGKAIHHSPLSAKPSA